MQMHNIIELETIASTNEYAGKLLKVQQIPEGTIIFAREQTAGRGQGKNKWESEPGKNLTFSMILFPHFLVPERQFYLNKVITLGILDFLAQLPIGEICSVKWPNDIYAGKGKLGGILINNHISGNKFETCIAGIGINVNQEVFSPALPNPVSIKQLTGEEYQLRSVLESLADFINIRYQQLESGILKLLDTDYRNHMLGIDSWQEYLLEGKVLKGKNKGVDETGRMLIETLEGKTLPFHHGEIEFVLR
jgi:BirA family biotin operon repressor/biotin-[acetyl-CoA-carboxylase] ligase